MVLTDIHGNCAVSSVSDSGDLCPAFGKTFKDSVPYREKMNIKRQLQTVHITADRFADENGFDKEQIKKYPVCV